MKSDNPAKHFVLAFVIALAVYVIFYQGIEYRRTRKGPWQVTFTQDSAGNPVMVINQPKLSIADAQISFPGRPLEAMASDKVAADVSRRTLLPRKLAPTNVGGYALSGFSQRPAIHATNTVGGATFAESSSNSSGTNHQAPVVTRQTLIFRQPRQVPYGVPFGKCIFMDMTFLPGTLTFQCFGHEIELLPRVLMIDHEEHQWSSGT